ncbi:hypothetical protein B5X24_HaOG210849 [Helicoverpa armigera]|nr:hypothetical protein B5X24_HaOG210849 [Helicoverpa armigera]
MAVQPTRAYRTSVKSRPTQTKSPRKNEKKFHTKAGFESRQFHRAIAGFVGCSVRVRRERGKGEPPHGNAAGRAAPRVARPVCQSLSARTDARAVVPLLDECLITCDQT